VEGACLQAAVDLENALNEYVDANSKWDQCIGSDYCTTRDVQPYWTRASGDLDGFDSKLAAIRKPGK
jgi:hypothetical protein